MHLILPQLLRQTSIFWQLLVAPLAIILKYTSYPLVPCRSSRKNSFIAAIKQTLHVQTSKMNSPAVNPTIYGPVCVLLPLPLRCGPGLCSSSSR